MTVYTDLLQALVNAGGAIASAELTHHARAWRSRLHEMTVRGLLVREYRITDEGRAYLAAEAARLAQGRPPRVSKRTAMGFAALEAQWLAKADGPCDPGPYPVATTDDQIEEIKRKAQEDRALMQDTTPNHAEDR